MRARLSGRTEWELGETPYARAVREARVAGGGLFDLTVSNPTQCGFAHDAGAVLGALGDERAMHYEPDALGLVAARAAVAGYYAGHRAQVDAGRLVMTASTSESYSFLFRLLCDAGDEVLIGQPGYPLFDFLARLDDVELRPYSMFYDHGWWIDMAELERRIGPRTRAIVVVHPNNPTGHWTSTEERRRLEALCAERGLALIVDEVFLDYPLTEGGNAGRSFAEGSYAALTFVLSGLSKIAALPQMKAAWIAVGGPGAEEALARLEVIADTFLSVSGPVQWALPRWLAGSRAMQAQILARVRENQAVLEGFAEANPGRLRVLRPEAGWAAVVSLPGCGARPDCAERLVRERGVIVHPGSFYGLPGANAAVVSLLTPTGTLRKGLERL